MDAELKELKSVLRSLVVSSPSQVDVCSLMRDYRRMVGACIPLAKYGYKEPVAFLRERCSDCFILHGPTNNPTLTLIVPETLKHIDKFVQSQKSNSTVKFKGKRRSVPGTITQPEKQQDPDLIAKTFQKFSINSRDKVQKSPDFNEDVSNHNSEERESSKPRNHKPIRTSSSLETKTVDTSHKTYTSHPQISKEDTDYTNDNNILRNLRPIKKSPEVKEVQKVVQKEVQNDHTPKVESSGNAVRNFLKKRMSLYNSSNCLDGACSINGKSSLDDDSGRQTSSSNSIKKSIALEELKQEVVQLVTSHPEGVWCTDLLRLYRERHGRELNFGRFGFTSIMSVVVTLDSRLDLSRPDDTGDWLLRPPRAASPAPPPRPLAQLRKRRPYRSSNLNNTVDPDDALPGIDFDPDVFPPDCMHFMESIPPAGLGALQAGALLDVMVGEVYSPSHFWLLRLGEMFHIAMEQMMDDMTEYYNTGEGRDRVLAQGAIRMGHYCSSLFDRDWHRSLIVNIIDSETVKVRHVDYGTVDVVPTRGLKPLLRKWGQLPAQAIRARLAGVRPGAAGRRWPHAASARFLQRVRDQRLVASVVGRDTEEDILEVFLVNTSTDQDECVSADLIRSGHADPRTDSCIRTSECYLFPKFAALENGATPNFAEISEYLRNGIALDYVDDYRRHVPDCLPPAAPLATPRPPEPDPSTSSESELSSPGPTPSPPSVAVANRIPLLPSSMSLPEPKRIEPASPEIRSEPVLSKRDSPEPEPASSPESAHALASTPLPPSSPPKSEPPPAPPAARPAAGVTLSATECEMFQYLSRVDPAAAHWFMVGALGRAAPHLTTPLNISAPEFRPASAQFRPNAPQFQPNAPQFQPNAPQFQPNAPQFQPNAPQFRPNTAAPEFHPRASPIMRFPPQPYPHAPQQFPPMQFLPPSHFGPYAPPAGFMPPPGFGPC